MGPRCSARRGPRVARGAALGLSSRALGRRLSFREQRVDRLARFCRRCLLGWVGDELFGCVGGDEREGCEPWTAKPPFSAGSQSSSFRRAPETTT